MDQPAVMNGKAGDGHARLSVDQAFDLARVRPLVALVSAGLAAACGGTLLLRRLSGALVAAPPPGATLSAIVGLAILALLAESALARGTTGDSPNAIPRLAARLARGGVLAGLLATAAPPRLSGLFDATAAIAAWGIALAVAFRGDFGRLMNARVRFLGPVPWAASGRAAPAAAPAAAPLAAPAAPPLPAGTFIQRFERFLLPDGSECVRGRLSVVVAAGTRSGSGHLGFCPPLAACPTVDASTDYDGVEAVVSAAEVLPWGIRVECRLDEPAEETIEIPIDLLAKVPA